MLKRVPIIVKAYQITFVSCREIGEKTYVATQGGGKKHDFAGKYTPLKILKSIPIIVAKFNLNNG